MILLSISQVVKRKRFGLPYVDRSWYREESSYYWNRPYVTIIPYGIQVDTCCKVIDMNDLIVFVDQIGAELKNVEVVVDPDYDNEGDDEPFLTLYIYYPKVPWALAPKDKKKKGKK